MPTMPYLTSKEVMERAGLSRATLNNYISLGILPKPQIAPETGSGRGAPRIGYFPSTVIQTLDEVDALKRQGLRMRKIAEILAGRDDAVPAMNTAAADRDAAAGTGNLTPPLVHQPSMPAFANAGEAAAAAMEKHRAYKPIDLNGPLKLTVEDLSHPAYLVNRQFEIEWCNEEALNNIFGSADAASNVITDRSAFRLFLTQGPVQAYEGLEEILHFHLAIAKNFLTYEKLMAASSGGEKVLVSFLLHTFEEVEQAEATGGVLSTDVNLAPRGEKPRWHRIYATFFREGVFFSYAPIEESQDNMLSLLARRDLVIRDLLKKRKPYLTPLAVLVADLQQSCKICAELPPEEYFNLINEIWTSMEPLLRQFYATHGKHVGDGMLYYFLPQPDSNYVYNAIQCAIQMREKMREICAQWNSRKNWINDLVLNIGIDEGQEWFGTYQTPTHIEFTALGDTINNAARLSDFARDGSVWVTKNGLSNLEKSEKKTLTYGVKRTSRTGEEVLVRSTFARIGNLTEGCATQNEKFQEIAALPITQVLNLVPNTP